MVEHPDLGLVDARIARYFDAEEAERKAARKENFKDLTAPVIIVGVPMAVFAIGFCLYLPFFNISPAKDVAGVIEEWSTANPAKSIPTTEDFMSYPSYLNQLGMTAHEAPFEEMEYVAKRNVNPDEIMVKVVKDEKADTTSGFTVCSYVGDENGAFYTYDSRTGEPVKNEVMECS